MSFTYDPESLGTDLAKVRLRIGDTNKDDALLTDEEIQVFLDLSSTVLGAAILSVKAILAKLGRDLDVSAAGINSRRTSRFQQYKELLDTLVEGDLSGSGSATAMAPHVGGISISRATSAESASDFRNHSFGVGMHDRSSSQDDLDTDQ